MSDQQLRSKLIRLAHSRPDLRPHLLPLVTPASHRTARSVAMKDLKKDMAKTERTFQRLFKVNQKAEQTLGDWRETVEDAGSKPEYFHDPIQGAKWIKESQEQIMTLGMNYLKTVRPEEKKAIDAIRTFLAKIDTLGPLDKRGQELRKDAEQELRDIEDRMKQRPKDWKEMVKIVSQDVGPRMFSYATAFVSRLVENVTGELF